MLSLPKKLNITVPFSIKGSEKKIVKVIDRLEIERSDNLAFVDPASIKISAIPLRLRTYHKLDDFIEHLSSKMAVAVKSGAQLVCFPELVGLIPLTMLPKYDKILSDYKNCASNDKGAFTNDILYEYFDFLQEVYFTAFSELACQYGVFVLAGSVYVFEGEKLYNRSYLFDPDGDVIASQDKLNLTEDEVQIGVTPGESMTLMQTKLGNFCVAIGQDNCYFEVYRIAKGLGAQFMLCPTCNLNYGCRHPNLADVYLRVQETALYGIKVSMSGDVMQRRFGGVCGIYAPASIASERQGILASNDSDMETPIGARINLQKLDNVFSPNACDINEEFSASFAAKHYDIVKEAEAAYM